MTRRKANEPFKLLSLLPSPIDLWEKRTLSSLLLLPVVFCIYAIFQLPLHFNSKTNVRTVDDLSETEWKGRLQEVDELSKKLHHVRRELGTVHKDQKQIKGSVKDLKHRLHHLKLRRGRREVYLNTLKKNNDQADKDLVQQKVENHNRGVAKDGPLASLSMVKSAAVATFVGKKSGVNTAKKED